MTDPELGSYKVHFLLLSMCFFGVHFNVFWLKLTLQYAFIRPSWVICFSVILVFNTATHFESKHFIKTKVNEEQINSDVSLRIIKQTHCFINIQITRVTAGRVTQKKTVLWLCREMQPHQSTNPYSVPRGA